MMNVRSFHTATARRSSGRTIFFALALALALGPGCGSEDEVRLMPLEIPSGCNPLATSKACVFPFPSAFHTRADATSPTGVRVDLDAKALPLRDGSGQLDVRPYNAADGFSPVSTLLLHLGAEVDLKGLPDAHHIGDSLKDGSTVALIDLETGKRVMHFVEMDRNVIDGFEGRYAFMIRPLEPMVMGHRHLVVIKNDLRDTGGHVFEPSAAFRALRDGTRTTSHAVESLRARYDELFAFAGNHGYTRGEMLIAWELPVASAEHILGPVLSMRSEALAAAGTTGLPYTISDVKIDPNADTARIIFGDFEVPTYLQADDSFTYDERHHPIRQKDNRKYPFTMVIPAKAKAGPLPLGILGHGIFGNGRSFLTGTGDGAAIQKLANQYGMVVIATDWIGLSTNDVIRIGGEVAPNLDRASIITDQLQQSLINTLVLTKLARGKLKDDPLVKLGTPDLLDARTFYWGASLGGIQGSGFVALSNDIHRAVFGVPGSAWSTMIQRSTVFPPLKMFLAPHYPDPLDFAFGVALLQARFDYSDPANLSKLMFERPLPDAPKDRIVILQEAIGDSEVPNITTEILARAMGIKVMIPNDHEVFGLETVTSPTTSSALTHYRLADYANPAPPEENLPPAKDNGVHHAMNFLPNVHQQIFKLFFEGKVEQFCTDACDPD
jgi:hypothetical protein